ncbi:hypothetical protein N7520_010015 [Penicillium odoratum]|uniref:uncharacterized protein n=1 Tax=Penicillium odoratum TaxID=1167516 RepID=UPI0025476EFF|nr:uncharacterized protein N7520_010015 [Penicillium odoratum]KAJ5753098.1 hypothetical protein N7520_010015 [Penicillium odoratum]
MSYLRFDAFESQASSDRRQIEAASCARLPSQFPCLHTLNLSLNKRPSWPDLKTVDIQSTPSTPSGKWLFVDRSDRDKYDHYESSDSDPHDEFPEYVRTVLEDRSGKPVREVSGPGLFNDLYMAVGQAALCMPKLELLTMETEAGRGYHRFKYSSEEEAYAKWSDPLGFQPEERLLNLWNQVGSKNTGGDLTVKLCND